MKGNFHPLARILRRGTPSLASLGLLLPFAALANPSGADIVHGNVGISSPTPGGLVIDQTSHAAIINWQQFSIGDGEYVLFNQPSASAAVLNRVLGGSPSEILGDLSANGRVFLINPQGVMFGAGSQVDVGSLVVSTHDLADQDFLGGRYVFAGSSPAAIDHAGAITTADGGFVVLAAEQVHNRGLIQARLGEVVLAAGGGMRFELDTGGLVNFQIDAAAASDAAGVDNLGDIVAEGGNVLMSARVARDLASTAVNNRGRIVATGIEAQDGAIYLVASGGHLHNSGRLDASGGNAGTVQLYGDADVTLADGSVLQAQGGNGGRVLAIAEGTLVHAAGSTINVSAEAGTPAGGFVELSGHGDLSLRGDVVLGSNGHLLIDPTHLIVGDQQGDSLDFATLENLLQNNPGARVELIASDLVQIRERAGAQTLNGRDANGNGASLFMGIGYSTGGCSSFCGEFISFSSGSSGFDYNSANFVRGTGGYIYIGDSASDDTLDIAGDITLMTGGPSEAIGVGQIQAHAALRAGGAVHIEAIDDIVTGSVTAGIPPQPTGSSGEGGGGFFFTDGVTVAPGLASGEGLIQMVSDGGSINTGALKGAFVELYGEFGDINVHGTVDADDHVEIDSGRTVTLDGTVTSGGNVLVYAQGDGEFAGIRVDGDISARGIADLYAASGDIDLASVAVTRRPDLGGDAAQLWINAADGEVSVLGDLSATSDQGLASINVNASNGVRLDGDVLAQGVRGAFTGQQEGGSESTFYDRDAAWIYINSTTGAIEVSGVLRGHGLAGTVQGSGEGGTYTSTVGYADVSIYGRDVSLGGLDVSGVGQAGIWLDASDGNVRIAGPVALRAEAGEEETTQSSGASTLSRRGIASLSITAENGEVSTQGLSVTGTFAGIGIEARTIRSGSGSDGAALTVRASGDAATEGLLEWREPTGPELPDAVTTSDYGLALIALSASGGDDSTPGIAVVGDVSAEGPSALTALFSDSGVLIDGDIAVSGLGYTNVGAGTGLFDDIVQPGEVEGLFGLRVPRLDSGQLTWGESSLVVAGYVPLLGSSEDDLIGTDGAGDVTVTGDIQVSGRGQAHVQIAARSLDVEGPNGVHITAALGQLAGLQHPTDDVESPSMLRRIGGSLDQEGVTGTASYSEASFLLKGDGSSQSAFDATGVQISGGTAQVVVEDMRSVRLGNLGVLGGRGEQAPVYAEMFDGGQQGGPWTTEIVGGLTTATIDTGPSGGIEILGPTVVEGTGATALVLLGGSVQLGSVSVAADRGRYVSNNPNYVSDDIRFGDAAVFLSTSSTDPVTVSSLTATAEDDLHLGARLDVTGDVSIEAGGAIDNTIPGELLAFVHPLSTAVALSNQDQILPPTDISARNISVSFTQAPDLVSLSLAADETLTLDGNGSLLNLDTLLNLQSNSLSLVDIEIISQNLQLSANQDLSIVDSRLSYNTGMFTAGRNILVDNSSLVGQGHSVQAGTAVQIRNASTISGGEGNADTIGISAAAISIAASQLSANTLTLTAPGITVQDASTLRAPSIQLGGETVTLGGSNLFGNTITVNPTTSLSISGGRIAGSATGAATAVTLAAPMIQILGGATLDADTLNLGGIGTNELSLGAATLNGALSAQAATSITLNGTTLTGPTGSLTQTNATAGGGIDIRNSSLGYSGSLLLDSARALFVEGSSLGAAAGTADLTLSAGGALTLSTALLNGDQVSIEGDTITLGGGINASQLGLEANGALVSADESLLIEAGAIDAIAEMINLEGATLAIGSGAAVNGIDTSFLDQVPSELRASSLVPNASFIASGPDGVRLGTLTLDGGYLYVRAASATATQIGVPEGRLFFNYRPFDDEAAVELPTESGLNIEAIGATLAIGGTGYGGDITILQPPTPAAKEIETFDYVFLTGGSIFNPNTLNTTGQVVFLGGTVVNEPGPEEPPPNAEPAEQAADAQVIASNLASEASEEEDGPSIEIALIEEESSSAIVEEFQCR